MIESIFQKPLKFFRILLPNQGPTSCFFKGNTPETSVGRAENVALVWRPATGVEGGPLSENQLLVATQETGGFKGEFKRQPTPVYSCMENPMDRGAW